jgi:hypothetical protein
MPFTWRININRRVGGSGYEYSPSSLSAVTIADEIIWTNNDDAPHWPGLADNSGTLVNKTYFMANQIAPHSPSAAFEPGVNETVTFVDSLDASASPPTGSIVVIDPASARSLPIATNLLASLIVAVVLSSA